MVVRFVAGENAERPNARRFALAGVGATVVDVGVAIGLVSAGLGRLPAGAAALVIAAIVSRILHARYTLRGDQLDRWIRQPPVFATVAIVAGSSISPSSSACPRCGLPGEVRRRGDLGRDPGLSHASCCSGWCAASSPPRCAALCRMGSGVSVVVPAYREEARIADTVARIRSELDVYASDLEIVVVDDGSPDGTADAAQRRCGPGGRAAAEPGKGARCGLVCSPPAAGRLRSPMPISPTRPISSFVRRGDRGWYDVAIGNRHHADTDTLAGTSGVRSFGSRVVNMATSLMLLGNYRDTQWGAKRFVRTSAAS